MRKSKRQKDAAWALDVFDKAPYITVSMTRPDGTPYGLPLSLARKAAFPFYVPGAAEGAKTILIPRNGLSGAELDAAKAAIDAACQGVPGLVPWLLKLFL